MNLTKKKKIWIGAAAVVVLGAIVFFSINATRKDEVLVQTAKTQRKDVLKSKVAASGEIRAKEFVDLQSEVTGVITEVAVREGDTVAKGDILLKIDPLQTEAETSSAKAQYDASSAEAQAQAFQIMNAESGLARDQAALRSSRAQLEQAENNNIRSQASFKRKQQLHEDGLISREEYEAAQNDARAARAQLEVAKAQVAQMETQIQVAGNTIQQMKTSQAAALSRAKSVSASLIRATDQLSKTVLRSPLSGVITQLAVEKGERAVPGMMFNPQATLMTIADLSVIQAELKVDETDIVNLTLGDPAQIKVDALPDVVLDGEVTEIGNSPIKTTTATTQEAKDFKVVVTIKNPSNKLRPGMSCTGDIITDTKENVLVVPIQALTIREVEVDKDGKYHEPDLKKKKPDTSVAQADTTKDKDKPKKKELEGVFVVGTDKVARFRPVKTGITGETDIEILDNLKEGEEIVSGSFQTLRTIKDGASVKIDNTIKAQAEKKS
jgi:HlyD family secretion protein